MTGPISLEKQYRTRSGRAVRIFALDGGGGYPVMGAVDAGGGVWASMQWTANGAAFAAAESPDDLIEVKPTRTGWVNIYSERVHETREKADRWARAGRLACLQITFTEGEGL